VIVEVRLFATLSQFLPAGSTAGTARVDVPEGATIADVTQQLGIPPGLERVLLLNGTNVEADARLRGGDVVDIFPPLAGGSSSIRGERRVSACGGQRARSRERPRRSPPRRAR
jgi:molybdopterin converting factor small subunit